MKLKREIVRKNVVHFLNELEKIYIPGTTKYFNKFEPNPWQLVYDEIESKLKLNGFLTEKDHKTAIEKFSELTEAYKRSGTKGAVGVVDFFVKGDFKSVESTKRSQENKCSTLNCGGLKLKPFIDKDGISKLYCTDCLKNIKSSRRF